MALYGLTGYPLGHSFSPGWFNTRFKEDGRADVEYRLFPLPDITGLNTLLDANPEICGLNVTIPHKKTIMPLLSGIDPVAQEIGAVNTVTVERRDGVILTHGYNTDGPGFLETLPQPFHHTHALVLGTGGSSAAVAWALRRMNVTVTFVSRTKRAHGMCTYDDLDRPAMEHHTLVVNTTPAGMAPETTRFPAIPYQFLTGRHLLYDLIYNPPETECMIRGRTAGATVMNGQDMLHAQARLAYRIFMTI